jgi:adenosylhomocysteine nucleosidase
MRVGVLGAMPEEVAAVIAMLAEPRVLHAGGRDYTRGTHHGHEVVAVHSRIGKVASASAAVELIVRFGVEQVLFTGLAGGLAHDLHPGDAVIAEGLLQHDLDASPLFPPLEVPMTGCSRLPTCPIIRDRLERAARASLDAQQDAIAEALGGSPRRLRVVRGDVATGDQFIAGVQARDAVRARVPSALCVEMEGAAVAQVCLEYDIPFGVVRMISDSADASAGSDFAHALGRVAGDFAGLVVARYLGSL